MESPIPAPVATMEPSSPEPSTTSTSEAPNQQAACSFTAQTEKNVQAPWSVPLFMKLALSMLTLLFQCIGHLEYNAAPELSFQHMGLMQNPNVTHGMALFEAALDDYETAPGKWYAEDGTVWLEVHEQNRTSKRSPKNQSMRRRRTRRRRQGDSSASTSAGNLRNITAHDEVSTQHITGLITDGLANEAAQRADEELKADVAQELQELRKKGLLMDAQAPVAANTAGEGNDKAEDQSGVPVVHAFGGQHPDSQEADMMEYEQVLAEQAAAEDAAAEQAEAAAAEMENAERKRIFLAIKATEQQVQHPVSQEGFCITSGWKHMGEVLDTVVRLFGKGSIQGVFFCC